MRALLRLVLPVCTQIVLVLSIEQAIAGSGSGSNSGSGSGVPEPTLLRSPVIASSEQGQLNVSLELVKEVFHGPCHDISTRMYRYQGKVTVPGPTLSLKKGATLNLKLSNTLTPDPDEGVLNRFRLPNTTNFHTHGLHVSPNAPADDVLSVQVRGGDSYQYKTTLPDYHAPGIYWYHPHQHGSTALQVGGGAMGGLVIEENDKDGVSEQVASLPKELLIINQWSFSEMDKIAHGSNDTIWGYEANGECSIDETLRLEENSFYTVNGQYRPFLEMEKGQWKRLQIINANMMQWLSIQVPEQCEFQLLAKDGVFLKEYPREVKRLIVPAGGRSDLAVRCNTAGDRELQSIGEVDDDKSFLGTAPLLSLKVQETTKPVQPDLIVTSYQLPCYLPDLTKAQPSQLRSTTFTLTDDETTKKYMINGQQFNPASAIYSSTLESIEEWTLKNANYHSFHVHAGSFQLTTDGPDNYLKAGDWHDTIFYPSLPESADSSFKIRMQPERYAGNYVMHCHILPHEDQGMMAYARFDGEDGASNLCPVKKNPKDWVIPTSVSLGVVATVAVVVVVMVVVSYYVFKHKSHINYQELPSKV